MSVDLYVLCETAVPDNFAWHAAIERQHFALTMDDRFDPTKDTGFWPAKLSEKETGFEYYTLLRSEWERLPNLEQPSRFKSGIILTTHSDLTEFVASILGAVALARACGGVVYDPQGSKMYEGPSMNDLLKQIELAKSLERSLPHIPR